jgi:hypothetical protein
MLRRLFASVLVMGSAVALSTPSANAQSVNVPFTASVGANCTFGTPTPGTLVLFSNRSTLIADPTYGTPGRVTLQCSAPANITLSAPNQTGGPNFTPIDCQTYISLEALAPIAINQSCAGTATPGPIRGTNTLNVSMRVTSGNAIAPGDYAYNVTLSIVP